MKREIVSKRMLLYSLLLSLNLMSIDSYSEDNLKQLFESTFLDYTVLHYRKGNFTNSKLDEYVVFLKEKRKYKAPPQNIPKKLVELFKRDFEEMSKRNDINKVVVVILKNKKIKELFELKKKIDYRDVNVFSGEYDKRDLEFIKKGNPQFGTWDGYCYLNDFNENGLDEILFFELTGMSFSPYIFEFKKDSMQVVLDPPPTDYNIITELKTINEKGKKIIKIFGGPSVPEGKRDWFKYKWDSMK